MKRTWSNERLPKYEPLGDHLFLFSTYATRVLQDEKNRISGRDVTKRVFSETSHDGYVTADDGVALTNYMGPIPGQNYVIVYIDVE